MDRTVLRILERMLAADDLADACSIVLGRAIAERGFARAIVALGVGMDIRGAGWGVSHGLLNEFLEQAREPGTAAAAALAVQQPTLLPESPFPGGLDACVALPFSGPGAVRGAVLVEAAEFDARLNTAAELVRRCGTGLGHRFLLERALNRAERTERYRARLARVVEALPDPVLVTDADQRILFANQRAEHLFSAAAEDSQGRRRAVQINNLLFSSFRTQAVIGSRDSAGRELTLVDPLDGSDLLFEVISVPLPGTAGGDDGMISILRDITDLRRALGELEVEYRRSRAAEHGARRERDRLNAILENVSDPILVTDEHANIILMNRAAERLFDVPASAARGRKTQRIVQANDTHITSLISNFLLQQEDRCIELLALTDPETGAVFTAEVVGCKIPGGPGEATAIVSVLHDLTQAVENERLARELQRLNSELEDRIRHATLELEERNRRLEWQSRELEKASRLKSEFVARMSHELRTPINVVIGYTSIMSERIYGDLTPRQADALDKIRTASRHLLDLINDILDLSKIEAGRMPVRVEPVRLEEVVYEVSVAIESLLRDGVDYQERLSPDLPTLRTDRTKLRQVLLNLVSNAVKFTHEGSVVVSAEPLPGGERIRIRVADTGIGISQEHLETIFDDFRQVDQTPTREYGGTGLGLAITRRLLRLLGGSIDVQSERGRGSVFAVELPVELEDPSEAELRPGSLQAVHSLSD